LSERLVREFYERLWNAWDDDAVEEVLAPDFTFRGSLGDETRGLGEWRAYRDAIRRGSHDFHNEIVDLVGSGDRVAARLRYSGTHTGPLLEIEPTARRFEFEGAAFFIVVAGRLESAWVLGDVDSLRRQLAG
jgi:predicted ester cyclase